VRAALVAAILVAFPSTAQAPAPAALDVDATCVNYAATHTLVRNDVLAKMDAAEVNLPKCEDALRQAQADLQAMKAAAEELQRQKDLLQEHVKLLEQVIQAQPAPREPTVADTVGAVWEWVDAPVAFAAGTGMCIGVAWGLNAATR